MEILVRADGKGRIVIPKEVRERLGITSVVKLKVEDDKLIVIPVHNPLEELKASVMEGTRDVATEIRALGRAARTETLREARSRW